MAPAFYIVGVGGTGGYLAPVLARMLNSGNFTNPTLYLWDGDLVEYKNIERQNFIEQNIGFYKSEVLANRYRKVFKNVKIMSITSYLGDQYSYRLHDSDSELNVVISCVDSIDARKEILREIYSSQKSTILIDSGNEDQYGHVTVSFIHSYVQTVVTQTLIDVLTGKVEVVQGSCATLGEQTLIQNNLQAAVIMKMLLNLTNIAASVCDINNATHPLNQLSINEAAQLGEAFTNNKLLISTYNTGSLSSKYDVVNIEQDEFKSLFSK